ncbi:MAG: hypothetical protein JEZ11_13230 [Desulfobacterales bacterium]|nr:hypothetical protein [Desulfobacterales bacterium]
MKKFSIFALAALMVVAFALPASALENTFGGYWETTFATLNDSDAAGGLNDDQSQVDVRLRLYYTAGINDNLKIVSKFEIDYGWGDQASGSAAAGAFKSGGVGDVGADGKGAIEVKNVYADFKLGPVGVKMGTQGFTLARGIIYDTDGTGLTLVYSPNDMITIPFVWLKTWETTADTANNEDDDFDIYGLVPVFKFGEGISVQGMIVKAATDNLAVSSPVLGPAAGTFAASTELDAWFYGVDASAKFGPLSVYGTYIIESGEITPVGAASIDLGGFAMDMGVSYDMGMFSLRGEYAMLSGDDDGIADNDLEAFTATSGESWNKGELLFTNGILWKNPYGTAASPLGTGAPAQNNFLATSSGMKLWNIGATVKPMDKLALKLDYFDASYAETAAGASDDIGSEIDFVATYQLLEGLNLDVLACFFQVGDSINPVGTNDEDQTMYGARFSVAW